MRRLGEMIVQILKHARYIMNIQPPISFLLYVTVLHPVTLNMTPVNSVSKKLMEGLN